MNGGAFFQGFPFEVDDIFKHSLQLAVGHHEVFAIPELESLAVSKEFEGDLWIPDLDTVNGIEDKVPEPVDSDAGSLSTDVSSGGAVEEHSTSDVWTLDLELGKEEYRPRIWTWESFEKKSLAHSQQTAYLSEAGPEVFDAALTAEQVEPDRQGVLPQDVMLAALCNLVLGRSSVFFQWNLSKQVFEETLDGTPTSGSSLACHRSLVTRLIDCGSRYRILSEHASGVPPIRHSCTALIAFKGCVTSVLDAIDSHVTSRRPHIRSLLQLQALIERPYQLIDMLNKIANSIHGHSTDEAIVSAISDGVHEILCSDNAFDGILQEILARVSQPWLEHLCADLGLTQDPIISSSISAESVEDKSVDGSNPSFAEPSPLREDPGFVTNGDRILIQETKKTLKILRQHLPSARFESLQYRGVPMRSVPLPAVGFELAHTDLPRLESTMHVAQDRLGENKVLVQEGLVWADGETQQSYLADLEARMSQPLVSHVQDRLHLAVAAACDNRTSTNMDDSSRLDVALPFDPLESLRPLLQSHVSHVNRTLLLHLFKHCKLRQHLDLQRQFHLLGNGNFLSRLTRALFGTDTQSAERKRGRIPTAEMMGLRLGARDGQSWPPASSEIQLTLMGILSDTYQSTDFGTSALRAKQLPGNLSFAIRELPEEEIEKVLDSASIHALDFLRLAYSPSPPLDAMLTTTAMQAYDDIFRFLLKLVRVLHVTTGLREMCSCRCFKPDATTAAGARFSTQAHHFATVLMSHFTDIGIEATWQTFQTSLDRIERSLDRDDEFKNSSDMIGLDGLRQSHETCVEGIRTKLFLKRKLSKLRSAVEGVLVAILKCAASLENPGSAELEHDLNAFQDFLAGLLGILRGVIEKTAKDSGATKAAEDEIEAMRMLLARLSWNEYYEDVRS